MGDKEPNNSEKQVSKQQRYLSCDLIFQEILIRLPIKSILRFELVSKHWHSTLSSSEFANANLMKSPFSHPSAPVNTLFIKSHSSYYIFSYDDDQVSGNLDDDLFKVDVDFGIENEDLILTGCCNGLICLTTTSYEYFILWNPATRKMHKYESDRYLNPHDAQKWRDFDFDYDVALGFGYASSLDDYKYVQILPRRNVKVHIFSLREKQWRKIDFKYGDVIKPYHQAVLFKEKLYWLAFCTKESITTGNLLVSFDLVVERFEIHQFGSYEMSILGARGEASFDNGVRSFWRQTVHLADTSTKPMEWTTLLRFNEPIKVVRYVPSLVSPFPILESV